MKDLVFNTDKIKSEFNQHHQGVCTIFKDISESSYSDIHLYFLELAIFFGLNSRNETFRTVTRDSRISDAETVEVKSTRALQKIVSEFESVKTDNWKL